MNMARTETRRRPDLCIDYLRSRTLVVECFALAPNRDEAISSYSQGARKGPPGVLGGYLPVENH